VSGKPLLSWPTFTIIAFELAILAAVLATIVAFSVHLWRAQRRIRGGSEPAVVTSTRNLSGEANLPLREHSAVICPID